MYFQHLIFVCLLLIIDNIIQHQMNKMLPCLCATYSIRLHGAECANLYHGSSVWPSELKWTNNNNNADEDDDDDKNCEDYKQTYQQKKHMKTWHTSIWEWIIRFSYLLRIYLNEVCFSYPMLCSHLTNCLAQRTQHSRWYYLSITKFNVRCFIISFRFVCLLVNGFCLRSISRGSEWLFILLYCMGVLSDASFMSFSISFCCCSFYLFSIFIHLAVKGRCSVFTTMDIITFV